MTTSQIIALVLEGIAFMIWAGVMFRTLFRLRWRATQQAQAENAGLLRRYVLVFTTMGLFFSDPGFRPDRRLVLITTVVLFASMALFFWVSAGAMQNRAA